MARRRPPPRRRNDRPAPPRTLPAPPDGEIEDLPAKAAQRTEAGAESLEVELTLELAWADGWYITEGLLRPRG